MKRISMVTLACALWQTGCGPRWSDAQMQQWYEEEKVAFKNRVSFELKCPTTELVVVDLDTNARGVDGCGRRATYIRVGYVWTMDSSTPGG